jgi:hypothetical protein
MTSHFVKTPARKVKSFECQEDVWEMLEEAKAAGLQIGDICNLALRDYGETAIAMLLAEREPASARLRKRLEARLAGKTPGGPTTSKPRRTGVSKRMLQKGVASLRKETK